MSSSKSQSKSSRNRPAKKDFRPKGRPLSQKKRREIAEQVITRLRDIDPEPECELFHTSGYQLLVSVVLSAQTTEKIINRVMEPLYKEGFEPSTVLDWGPEKFLEKIITIGLDPTKAKNVHKLSQILIDEYDGAVPDTHEELEALPGVVHKTSNVIVGELFKYPTLEVDTHVYRVTMRLELHTEANSDKCEDQILRIFDHKHLPAAHH